MGLHIQICTRGCGTCRVKRSAEPYQEASTLVLQPLLLCSPPVVRWPGDVPATTGRRGLGDPDSAGRDHGVCPPGSECASSSADVSIVNSCRGNADATRQARSRVWSSVRLSSCRWLTSSDSNTSTSFSSDDRSPQEPPNRPARPVRGADAARERAAIRAARSRWSSRFGSCRHPASSAVTAKTTGQPAIDVACVDLG